MSASYRDHEESGGLSSREKKILATIEQDIKMTAPALARHLTDTSAPKIRTPLRAAVQYGALLIIALAILIVAAALLPPGSGIILGALTCLLLVPWLLSLSTNLFPKG